MSVFSALSSLLRVPLLAITLITLAHFVGCRQSWRHLVDGRIDAMTEGEPGFVATFSPQRGTHPAAALEPVESWRARAGAPGMSEEAMASEKIAHDGPLLPSGSESLEGRARLAEDHFLKHHELSSFRAESVGEDSIRIIIVARDQQRPELSLHKYVTDGRTILKGWQSETVRFNDGLGNALAIGVSWSISILAWFRWRRRGHRRAQEDIPASVSL